MWMFVPICKVQVFAVCVKHAVSGCSVPLKLFWCCYFTLIPSSGDYCFLFRKCQGTAEQVSDAAVRLTAYPTHTPSIRRS